MRSRATAPRLRGYRHERLLLALVAVAALANLYPLNTQDVTRLSLSSSLVHRHTVDVDPYHTLMLDRAFRAGHWYSDKAPGMSLLAIPSYELFRAVDAARGGAQLPVWRREGQLWAIRVLTGGIGLLAVTLLVGRAGEALVAGRGAPVAVTFALGTIVGPLGPTMLEHDVAAAFGFGAFLLAWRRPALLVAAGAAAGTAVLFEYQAGLVCLVLAAYVAAGGGLRGLARFVAGAVPPAVVLGAYNTAAFGAPWRFSYDYVANRFARLQESGFFGIHVPS